MKCGRHARENCHNTDLMICDRVNVTQQLIRELPVEQEDGKMAAKFIAAGDLGGNSGQIQVFAIQSNGQIESRWKQTTDPDSGWTPWSSFQTPSGGVTSIGVGYLSDTRMQLFATDVQGNIWSCWKTTTSPSASWTAWSSFN
jgi:hypothetical protein